MSVETIDVIFVSGNDGVGEICSLPVLPTLAGELVGPVPAVGPRGPIVEFVIGYGIPRLPVLDEGIGPPVIRLLVVEFG